MPRYEDRRGPEEMFWDELTPEEPFEEAGAEGRRRDRGQPEGVAASEEEETGHSSAQYFHEPVREPYGGTGGSGEFHPYGGRRFAQGRETTAAKSYGELYGYAERGYGHRRDSFYAAAGATPWWDLPAELEEPSEPSFAGVGPRGYKRPDLRIEEEVVQRLADAEWIDASDAEVEVADGVVTLTGEVERREERRAAEDVAAEVAGVVDVINRLRSRRRRGH